ncbi:MAG: hypothetical protein M0Z84_03725 [Gammaproteobacteria bacterium]|nr:hypothetical protein [Gammaproteobacteria bacterium]
MGEGHGRHHPEADAGPCDLTPLLAATKNGGDYHLQLLSTLLINRAFLSSGHCPVTLPKYDPRPSNNFYKEGLLMIGRHVHPLLSAAISLRALVFAGNANSAPNNDLLNTFFQNHVITQAKYHQLLRKERWCG